MGKETRAELSLRVRLGWFGLLYVGGVLAAVALATLLHLLLKAQL